MDARFYPGYQPEWDNAEGRKILLSLLQRDHVALDVGAGGGVRKWTDLRGHAARVVGIDMDPRVLENPYLDEARVARADSIPYPDTTFDVAWAWNVVEHLEDPTTVFREVARVLKPGGVFLIKTPNLWHYVTTLSRALPHSLHERLVFRAMRRQTKDIFPTHYRCNTERRIRSLARDTGLRVRVIYHLEPRPEYLRFSPLTYPFGIAYERAVNASGALEKFRVILIALLERPV
ncbi:MAG TPA: class I SAM-dependent methyltransferase [Candidatus Krumholzibacteria bacterium]|nr:class I SAM-dependent methyltransferase [Candidatus Krumholzibacteria bacterium]